MYRLGSFGEMCQSTQFCVFWGNWYGGWKIVQKIGIEKVKIRGVGRGVRVPLFPPPHTHTHTDQIRKKTKETQGEKGKIVKKYENRESPSVLLLQTGRASYMPGQDFKVQQAHPHSILEEDLLSSPPPALEMLCWL